MLGTSTCSKEKRLHRDSWLVTQNCLIYHFAFYFSTLLWDPEDIFLLLSMFQYPCLFFIAPDSMCRLTFSFMTFPWTKNNYKIRYLSMWMYLKEIWCLYSELSCSCRGFCFCSLFTSKIILVSHVISEHSSNSLCTLFILQCCFCSLSNEISLQQHLDYPQLSEIVPF